MGYIGRRIGKSQTTGIPQADGSGGGVLDIFTSGYFQRTGNMPNSPGVLPIISITGGTTYTPGNGYKYHVFTYPNSDSFVVSNTNVTAEVLIVAGGGGGGGGYYTGGAGAGGIVYGPSVTIPSGTYTIKVGLGGTGSSGATVLSGDGQPSAFGAVTALGGGGGGSGPGSNDSGRAGGSAGGSSHYENPGAGTATPQPVPGSYTAYGNGGGASRADSGVVGGGGGGAGGAGGSTLPTANGGVGYQFPGFAGPLIPTLSPVVPRMGPSGAYYGGGGSGATPGVNRAGGFGGGGYGTSGGTDPGTPGVTATGATHLGGGGGGRGNPNGAGGNGGPGIVIIRYLV